MVCKRCGTDYADNLNRCPKCGEINENNSSERNFNANDRNITIFPMKWYLYLMCISMPLSFFSDLYNGLLCIVNPKKGAFELSASEEYSIDVLARLNLFSGIVCIVMALFAGYTWYNLFKRKKNSLICVNSVYIANMLSSIVFMSLMAFIDNTSVMNILSTMFVVFVIPTLIVVALNTIYFKKRSAFFVN